MEFSIKSGTPEKQRTACAVVGIFESRRLSDAAKALDKAAKGYITRIVRRGDMDGKLGQTLLLQDLPNTLAERVLLVGCGKEDELGDIQFRKIISQTVTTLNATGTKEMANYLTEIGVKERDLSWKIRQTVETSHAVLYRFNELKSKKDTQRRPLRKSSLAVPQRSDHKIGEQAIREGQAIANGMKLSKDLGNLPGNICTPSYLAQQGRTLAKSHIKLKTKVLGRVEMEKLGMGSLLSVAKGSRQEPKMIVMQYSGGKKGDKPIVLVGKGITFDSGGISLKPGAAMDEMKYDMCGAAGVLGTFKACTELDLKLNVVGIIPACENMPDGAASKPGDIVTSMSGQTIEVLNTDAEGRLILCDALTYSQTFKPEVVIDIATLTGACVIALGKHATGLLSNDDALTEELLAAGRTAADRAWELPLWDEYQDQIKSNFADMGNIGGRDAGTITAACFLSRFTKKLRWAHLDIAGTAWLSGERKGSTGRPVPLLTQYLLDRSNAG